MASQAPRLSSRLCNASRRSISLSYQCPRCIHTTRPQRMDRKDETKSTTSNQTHFGYETIAESLKESRVGAVFSSVASSYDTMNDLMSLGIHRLWKDQFVRNLDPGSRDGREPWHILDVAGGTGDIAFRMLDHATTMHNDRATRVTIADINADMLAEGRKRAGRETDYLSASNRRLDFIEANAEVLSTIPDESVDLYTVAFGIRNFTHKDRALREAFRVLKPGGVFACLEFSKLQNPVLDAVYKRWSFGAIPLIGQLVAGDRDSYQYLVESIERFPSQQHFADMIRQAGFVLPNDDLIGRDSWDNLTNGVAAIHKGIKPR